MYPRRIGIQATSPRTGTKQFFFLPMRVAQNTHCFCLHSPGKRACDRLHYLRARYRQKGVGVESWVEGSSLALSELKRIAATAAVVGRTITRPIMLMMLLLRSEMAMISWNICNEMKNRNVEN